MKPHLIQVAKILNRFPEVRWDRLTRYEDWYVSVFGWMNRDDGRSDFVVITWENRDGQVFTNLKTSSAEKSHEFGIRLHGDFLNRVHLACERVEHVLGELVPNCIRI